METKDLNSIGLAYLQMVEKKNTEAKKNHAKTLDKVNPEELEGDHEDRDDKDIDNDGDVDSSDEYLHKKRKAVKKAINKKDDSDDQEKFKAYTGDDKDGEQGANIGEDKEDKFEPHMMYDPKTGKGYKAEKEEDHIRMKKMGYTHDKPEEMEENKHLKNAGTMTNVMHPTTKVAKKVKKTEVRKYVQQGWIHMTTKKNQLQKEEVEVSADSELQEGAARQAAFAKGLMDYCKKIGKDHMDHDDFADHAKHVKADNWDKAKKHANDQDTEVREKIHSLAIKHLGQGAASALYADKGKIMKINPGDGKINASYNESIHMDVDEVLTLVDQGYTLDKAEAMVAEASCGTVNASRKQPKAVDNDRNMANDQRSIPAKGADTAPVRPGTKQNQRDFDKAARMAKPKDKVTLVKAPWDESVQFEGVIDRISNMVEDIKEASKPTGVHHSTPVTAAQANDEQAAGRATDNVARRGTMTEKEFLAIHAVPTTVDPAFDGNIAAKKTAEAIKEKPIVSPTPNIPTSKGDSKIMPDPTPVLKMENYVNYIKGDK